MKFDMGQAWNEAVALISSNREVLAIVAGIFFFLPSVVMTMLIPDLAQGLDSSDPAALENLGRVMQGLVQQYWWLFAITIAAQLIGYIALLALLRDDARPTVGDAILVGVKGLLPSLATYVLFVLAISAAFTVLVALAAASGVEALAALAVIAGLALIGYLAVKFSLSAPVIAIDKQFNPFAVLARSWRLTQGNSLRLFGFYLLLIVVYFVISVVLGIVVLALVAVLGDDAGKMINALVTGVVGTAVTVLFVGVLAAAHRQLSGPSAQRLSQTFD